MQGELTLRRIIGYRWDNFVSNDRPLRETGITHQSLKSMNIGDEAFIRFYFQSTRMRENFIFHTKKIIKLHFINSKDSTLETNFTNSKHINCHHSLAVFTQLLAI